MSFVPIAQSLTNNSTRWWTASGLVQGKNACKVNHKCAHASTAVHTQVLAINSTMPSGALTIALCQFSPWFGSRIMKELKFSWREVLMRCGVCGTSICARVPQNAFHWRGRWEINCWDGLAETRLLSLVLSFVYCFALRFETAARPRRISIAWPPMLASESEKLRRTELFVRCTFKGLRKKGPCKKKGALTK